MADMALFLGALLIVYVVPGPDMILLLETGALRGRGQALAVGPYIFTLPPRRLSSMMSIRD